MSTKINSVIVLLPNGRRQSMKVNLDSSILQVIEDVCSKHGFNPQEYALKHHNKILDPASVVRFCPLPNNAFLEMVQSKKQTGGPSSKVFLSLQVDGENERVTGEFASDENLESILSSLYPKFIENDNNKVPVVVYMRREIVGLDNLRTTTLRSLGLTSGRALLRFTWRESVEHPDLQCSGNFQLRSSLQPKSTEGTSSSYASPGKLTEESEERKSVSAGSCVISERKPTYSSQSIPAAEIVTAAQLVNNVIDSAKVDQNKITVATEGQGTTTEINKTPPGKEPFRKTPSPAPMDVEVRDSKNSKPVIKLDDVEYLDERHGLVFPLQDSSSAFSFDLPDSFFDITLDDLKLMMRDLKRNRESMENAPLRTEQLRDLEQQSKSRKYTKTVVRVQFPDRYVLQGVFDPNDTVADVANFVRNYIRQPNCEFCLYTSPPKNILSFEETLLSVGCVPCAKIYFAYVNQVPDSSTSECFLQDKVLRAVTSQDVASFAAGHIRRVTDNRSAAEVEISLPVDSSGSEKKLCISDRIDNASVSSPLPSTSNAKPSIDRSPRNSQQGKLPKWFKPK